MCNKNNTNNTIALETSQMGACSPANAAATAAANKAANLQLKQQAVGNAISTGFQIWSIFHPPKNSDPAVDASVQPDPEELERLGEAQREADAAKLLGDSNALLGSMNGDENSAGSPTPAASLNSLLDSEAPSNASTSAINSLLGDSDQPAASNVDATSAVAGLLNQPDGTPGDNGNDQSGQPSGDPLISSVTQNPQFIAAYGQVQDPPADSTQVSALDDNLFGDKLPSVSAADFLRNMGSTARSGINAIGDLITSHPMDSLAQSFSSAKEAVATKLGLNPVPNGDAVDTAGRTCMMSILAGGSIPHPIGAPVATNTCANAGYDAVNQGLSSMGMAGDQ